MQAADPAAGSPVIWYTSPSTQYRSSMCSDAKTADLPSAETGRMQRAFSQAFLIREFEQRLLKLFSEGLIFGTVHTCVGQEFSGIAVAAHLQPGDLIFTNH